jgi:flagellar hook-associated protein 3 FlgL
MSMIPSQMSLSALMSSSLDQYQTQLSQMEQTLSSGNNINQPSDNPTGVANLINVNASLSAYNQYQSNITAGQTVASLANASMTQAVNIVQQISSVLIQAGNPGVTKENAQGLASQIKGLEQSLLGVANTTYLGQAIFAGTAGTTTAYSQDSTGTVTYQGNTTPPSVAAAPNINLPTSLTNPFDAPLQGAGTGAGIFAAINQAITDLTNGSNIPAASTSDLSAVQSGLSALEDQAAQAGVNDAQFQVMSQQVTGAVTQAQSEVGTIQNANVAQLATQYQQELNNYQVALYATSQLNQPTLAHYL